MSDTGIPSTHAAPQGLSRADLSPESLQQRLHAVRSTLRKAGVSEWQVEAEVLLRHVLGLDRSDFLAEVYCGSAGLSESQSAELQSLLERRVSGEPLAYVVGSREFYGLTLEVDSSVLIPRQETELLVDIVLEHLAHSSLRDQVVVDVGTGSGAIALALAKHSPSSRILAADVSEDALDISRRNAVNLGLSGRIEFIHGDMLASIEGPIDVVVSNPPYIPSGELGDLAVEVRREPRIALDGGCDGLKPLRRLLNQSASKLAPNGAFVVELMPEQIDSAKALAVETFGTDAEVTTRQDLMGNERALVVKRQANGSQLPDLGKRHER